MNLFSWTFFCHEKSVMINFFITMSEILNYCNWFQDKNFSLQTNFFLMKNILELKIFLIKMLPRWYIVVTMKFFLFAHGALGGDFYSMISHCQWGHDLTNDLLLLLHTPPNSTSLLQMTDDFRLQYSQWIHRHAFIML